MARPKKTIIAKKPGKEQLKKTKEKIKKQVEAIDKATELKKLEVKPSLEPLESTSKELKKQNILEILEQQKKMNEENEKKLKKMLAEYTNAENFEEKLKLANTKYRTKYMQLEHERRQWQRVKDQLLDQIAELKQLLVQLAPDVVLFETVDKIAQITNPNHVATKRSLTKK